MKLAALILIPCALFAQFPLPSPVVVGAGGGGSGTGATNVTATAAGPVTSLAINITSLALTAIDPALLQCWIGTSTRTPLTITNYTTAGSSPITTVTPTFSSSSNVTCVVNSNGGAGPTGPTGPAGAVGATGPAGTNGTNGAISRIQQSGTPLAVEPFLNFTGAGVTCVDNSGSTRTDCTISGGGGGGGATGPADSVQTNSGGSSLGYANFTNDSQSVIIQSNSNYPLAGNSGDRTPWNLSINTDAWLSQLAPGFGDMNGLQVANYVQNGFYSYSTPAGSNNKSTTFSILASQISPGASQAFALGMTLDKTGVGDGGMYSGSMTCRGNPASGDETTCSVHPILHIQQDSARLRNIITGVTRSACPAMTIPAGVVGNVNAQTVTVSPNTTGCVDGDWLAFDQQVPTGADNTIAVQIVSHTSTTITAVFANNGLANVAMTPALVLQLDAEGARFGQYMPVVNLSATPVTTGTAAYSSGTCAACFVGTGTSWSTSMVGGNALNIGAISFTPDDDPATPFSGGDPNKDWYQIIQVQSGTGLSVYSFSVAGDVSYKGTCTTGCAYTVRPAVRMLRKIGNSSIVMETSTATWTVGDTVESVLGPFPDVTGMEYYPAFYSKGGTYRYWYNVTNGGHRTIGTAVAATNAMPNATGSDYPWAWGTGFLIDGAHTGMYIGQTRDAAISIIPIGPQDSTANSNIIWKSYLAPSLAWIGPHGNTLTADGLTIAGGFGTFPTGAIQFGDVNSLGNTAGSTVTSQPQMMYGGNIIARNSALVNSAWLGVMTGTDATNYQGWRMENNGSLTLNFHYIRMSDSFEIYPLSIGQPFGPPVGPFVPQAGAATSSVNQGSSSFMFQGSMWHSGAALHVGGGFSIQPETGGADATYDMQLRLWDSVNNNSSFLNDPWTISSLGIMKFGYYSENSAVDHRATLDPSGLSAVRTFTLQDASGIIPTFTGTPTNAQCATWSVSGSVYTLGSTACTSGSVTTSGSPAAHQVAIFSGASVITGLAVGTTDKPLVGVSASDPVFSKLTLTNPATGSTFTLADGKTLTASNTLTFAGTDGSSVNFGAGGTVAYTGSVAVPVTVVGSLGACNGGAEGALKAVTDATAPVWNTTLTGGGAVHAGARCNGTNWVAF